MKDMVVTTIVFLNKRREKMPCDSTGKSRRDLRVSSFVSNSV